MTTLNDYFLNLRSEVQHEAGIVGGESFVAEAFTRRFLDLLAEAGEIADADVSYYARTGMRVDGYAADENEDTLDLFITLRTDSSTPVRVEKAKVDAAFRQLASFYAKAAAGLYRKMEEVEPAFVLAQIICRQHQQAEGFSRIRLFLISDGIVNSDRLPDVPEMGNADVTLHVWDIERLFRWYSSGRDRERIVVDLTEDCLPPVQCLEFDQPGADYVSYLAIFPAEVLVSIYGRYGPRLLERNVRSFLQVRGDINKGIRSTILSEPDRFFAYNNGLTATAQDIDVERADNGSLRLKRLVDLQIVNGGQTTASLFRAWRKDKANLSRIAVQVKLNRVRDPDALDVLVGHISKFANSQNKVSVSDLSANDPFNQKLEELSRTIWAPATGGTHLETKWFYERARAQYADELARADTPARKARFEREYPKKQLFGKTDVAKAEMAWSQFPHLVSRGAQKCFVFFHEEVAKRGNNYQPDEAFFRQMIARQILFDTLDRITLQRKYSYKAQVVAYTLAWLSHRTAKRFDFDTVWREQSISEGHLPFFGRLIDAVHPVIATPEGGKNVTDWYKSEACWKAVQVIEIALPQDLQDTANRMTSTLQAGIDGPTAEEDAEIAWATTVPAETWFGIAAWAKESDSLASWQRSISFSLGKLAAQGRAPSRKQAAQGRKLFEDAIRLGFAPQQG
ncbi:AIPR family protein [Ralstonia wenshanensis]|uniref:AIPR family protein n=1 Tax=Ralstonia wenshanensis TaxID=2842456 RepID=UPI002AADB693|nr:AIPR family protein [Ralstonia wenshanensis]MDY7508150.1 AIPR family protein [Ralstonia wenshanensis]